MKLTYSSSYSNDTSGASGSCSSSTKFTTMAMSAVISLEKQQIFKSILLKYKQLN